MLEINDAFLMDQDWVDKREAQTEDNVEKLNRDIWNKSRGHSQFNGNEYNRVGKL